MCEHVRASAGKTLIFPGTAHTYTQSEQKTWAFMPQLRRTSPRKPVALTEMSFLTHSALRDEQIFLTRLRKRA